MPDAVRPVNPPPNRRLFKPLMAEEGADAQAVGAAPPRDNNKLRPQDMAAHRWYRFVLSYPPHLVQQYLNKFGADENSHVLDPFCGTGTTLVECKKQGIPSCGIEGNPVAAFASRTKLQWGISPDRLLNNSEAAAAAAQEMLRASGDDGHGAANSLFSRTPVSGRQLLTLPPESAALLLKGSISPLPLHKTLLLKVLGERPGHDVRDHQKLALVRAVVEEIGNLHFGPEVGVGPPKDDAPVLAAWLCGVKEIAADLGELAVRRHVPSHVAPGDARAASTAVAGRKFDIVITSPPYPNEKDYTRTTRLESVLLGFLTNKADLRALKENLVRSNTRAAFKADRDDLLITDCQEVQEIARQIEQRRLDLGKTSGFERMYARVTRLYFGGMKKHLADLRLVLRPGAQLAYVVGDQASFFRVMIRTGELLAMLAASLGYEVVGIDLFRTRISTATREQLREEVVLLRWPGSTGGELLIAPPPQRRPLRRAQLLQND